MVYEKLAHRISKKSTHNRFNHAAIVLKGGAVLAVGYNHENIHAEIHALKKLWPNKRKGTTVISLRFTKKSGMGNSKPCSKCMKFMKDNGVSGVEYAIIEKSIADPGYAKLRVPFNYVSPLNYTYTREAKIVKERL